jgi:hypothetical protein
MLHLVGVTNGDSIYVQTSGDGVIGSEKVNLDNNKAFNDTVSISFLYVSITSIPGSAFTRSTTLTVYRNANVLTVPLTSGDLRY